MPTIPNKLIWDQYERPVTQDELKKALNVVRECPDFKKEFRTDDPSTVLVPLKRYILTMPQNLLAEDAVASDARKKLLSMNPTYSHGPITDETIDKEYGSYDVLAMERGVNGKEEKILREAYSAYGINVEYSDSPYQTHWEKPISIPGVPAFGEDDERRQQTRKDANVFQTSEGVGNYRNQASKKDINTYSLYVGGGWHLDWDTETELQPGQTNAFPLDAESPSGLVLFATINPDGTFSINIDIVGSVARNPLLIGALERMTQIYETNAQSESQEKLEGWEKKEKGIHFYGSVLWNEKRLPRYSSIEERNKVTDDFGPAADPRWIHTLNTTGPRLLGGFLRELREEGKLTQRYYFPFPPSIRSAAQNDDEDAKWSLKLKKNFAATLEGGSHVSADGDIGIIEYAAPIRNIVTVQKSEVSEYPNIMQEWFPKGEVARFWCDPSNSNEAVGFILSGQKVQGEVAINRHRGNHQEENVFKFLAQQNADFFDEMTTYKPTESNGAIFLTAYKGKEPLGEPQRVDAVSSRAIYNTVAEHVWQEEFKRLDLSGNGFLENIVSERSKNSSEIGYALSSRYATTLSKQLDACRMLSYMENPSAESMDHAVASLFDPDFPENQDQKIQRHPGLYAEVVGNFLKNPNILEKHRHILMACMAKSQEAESEEEKKEHEKKLIAAATYSYQDKNNWTDIDQSASALSLDRQADVLTGYLQNESITERKIDEILAQSTTLFKYSQSNLIKVAEAASSSYRTSEQAKILREAAQRFPAEDRNRIAQSMSAREHGRIMEMFPAQTPEGEAPRTGMEQAESSKRKDPPSPDNESEGQGGPSSAGANNLALRVTEIDEADQARPPEVKKTRYGRVVKPPPRFVPGTSKGR